MKSIVELTKCKIRQSFIASKFIVPFISFVFLLYSVYCEASNSLVSTFTITLAIQYMFAIWSGYICNESEDPLISQLMLLKVNRKYFYYLSETCLHCCIAIFMSITVMFYPTVLFTLKVQTISLGDITLGFISHVFVGMMGLAVGSFFHHQVIKRRKNIVFLTLLIFLLSFIKASMVSEFQIMKLVAWVLPPISEILYVMNGDTTLKTFMVIRIMGISMTYYMMMQTLKTLLLIKNKF